MPFTANRAFKRAPRTARVGERDALHGRRRTRILDGTAGLWCVNAGHCREPIVRAIQEAAATLDFAPGFQMGHPLSFALAERVSEMLPGDLDHVFFANSGSEAVDSALKIALAYLPVEGRAAARAIRRPHARLPRRRVRRHLGRRHRDQQARRSRRSCCRRWTTCRTRTTSPATHSRAASRRMARSWPMLSSASCASAARRRSPR